MARFKTRSATLRSNTDDSDPGQAQAPPPRVLTIGPWGQREFAAATADICAARDWIAVNGIHEACDALRNGQQPCEIILLAQPLPGQIRQADVARLQQLAPLTRLVIVAGTWCEGELRSGTLPTGAIRLYWYELSLWWQAALRRRNALLCPHWSFPLDHAQAGRCSVARRPPTPAPLETTILIDTPDFASFETLAAALRAEGMAGNHQRAAPPRLAPSCPPSDNIPKFCGGIWEGGQLSGEELRRLTVFCSRVPGPVVALLDFPRVEHVEQTRRAGAAGLLAKPFIVEELVLMLQEPGQC